MQESSPIKKIILLTVLILGILFALIVIFHAPSYDKPIPLYTAMQPSIGNPSAKIHLVIFEDPKCNSCILYHQNTYPSLYKEYIKPGFVYYTSYLVADLPQSATIVKTLLCVHHQSPQDFFPLLDAYYKNPPLAVNDQELSTELFRLVTTINPSIQSDTLSNCLTSSFANTQTVDNTSYAKMIMGGTITTPTVFINGIRLTKPSYLQIKTLVDKELKTRK